MYKIFALIAFLGLPLGEKFANAMMKILHIFEVIGFFGLPFHGEKLEELGEKLENLDENIDKKLSGKYWDKSFSMICKLFILGPIYVVWLIMKWTFKLSWKLIRKIFSRRRA